MTKTRPQGTVQVRVSDTVVRFLTTTPAWRTYQTSTAKTAAHSALVKIKVAPAPPSTGARNVYLTAAEREALTEYTEAMAARALGELNAARSLLRQLAKAAI